MAKLVYDETGRLLFTKEMKEEYTILMPQMLPVHFGMFQRLLELEGYTVLRAYDGLEALDALHTHDVQLMILDVMMPRMDGLSATMQIRKEKNVPILLLSAKTEE